MRRWATVLLFAWGCWSGVAAAGRHGAGVSVGGSLRVTLLRLEGTFGPASPGTKELILEWERKLLIFQLREIRVLSGGRLGSDVLDEVQPFRPSFILRGPAEILHPLEDVAPSARVAITGYYRRAARNLFVSAIDIQPTPPAPE